MGSHLFKRDDGPSYYTPMESHLLHMMLWCRIMDYGAIWLWCRTGQEFLSWPFSIFIFIILTLAHLSKVRARGHKPDTSRTQRKTRQPVRQTIKKERLKIKAWYHRKLKKTKKDKAWKTRMKIIKTDSRNEKGKGKMKKKNDRHMPIYLRDEILYVLYCMYCIICCCDPRR